MSSSYLFLDPGVTTGYALFDRDGKNEDFGQVEGLDKLVNFLTMTNEKVRLEKVFYEPYILRNTATRNMNHHQKKGHQDTLQIIGTIKAFCQMNKIDSAEIKYVTLDAAYAHAGITKLPKSQHKISHQYDALAYGISYYITQGIIKAKRR